LVEQFEPEEKEEAHLETTSHVLLDPDNPSDHPRAVVGGIATRCILGRIPKRWRKYAYGIS
jgi:hypothetical protein